MVLLFCVIKSDCLFLANVDPVGQCNRLEMMKFKASLDVVEQEMEEADEFTGIQAQDLWFNWSFFVVLLLDCEFSLRMFTSVAGLQMEAALDALAKKGFTEELDLFRFLIVRERN